MIGEDFLWVEKYRPRTINECILPERLKNTFREFVIAGKIPNLLLSGEAGVGKTSVVKAMMNELQADYLMINGSMQGDIETLRNEILTYSTTVSLTGGRKYVILDEGDHLTGKVMAALRGFIEQFADNVSFIITCNFKNRIIEPIHSRCANIDFNFSKDEVAGLAAQLFKRLKTILSTENIEFDEKVLASLIKEYYPDSRRIINELQRYSATGKIDTGILTMVSDESYKSLLKMMKDKDFTSVRRWVGEHADIETSTIFQHFYSHVSKYFKPGSDALVVVLLGEYQYKAAFVADSQINLSACFAQIMLEAEFT